MLTIFTTPKPFQGHADIIQRNAIQSWCRLEGSPEVILIGDELGTAEVAREFRVRHERRVIRNEYGTKFLNQIFDLGQQMATREVVCYVNCDIMLMSDLTRAVEQVSRWRKSFLLIGRRWDVDIKELWDFRSEDWEERLHRLVSSDGNQRSSAWIDYFVFARGAYTNIPPFVIGRVGWDNWLVWKARSLKISVVDVSPSVKAVHQNHDYGYHPEGKKGVWQGEEAKRNYELAGGWTRCYSIADATHRLTPSGVQRNLSYSYLTHKLEIARRWSIDKTRPIRQRLGLRRATTAESA